MLKGGLHMLEYLNLMEKYKKPGMLWEKHARTSLVMKIFGLKQQD
jgi:hypothetical protein